MKTFGGNSVAIGKENWFESVSISDGVMFDDFLNGGWPCRYRVEMYPSKRCARSSGADSHSSFVNLVSLSSALRCSPSLMIVS